MTRPVRADINLHALRHNLVVARKAAPASRIMAVVKANAYGHGLTGVARALDEADAFGVASLEEAIALREAGIHQPIILLEGFFERSELDLIGGYRLEMVIHHESQVAVLEESRSGHRRPVSVWLKVDTGMHRLGFDPDTVPSVVQRLLAIPSVNADLRYMSHLPCADDRSNDLSLEQLHRFTAAVSGLPGERSLANSAAILAWPQTHLEWVRPGIMLYGISPLLGASARQLDLQPVMKLSTRLIAINRNRAGEAVGYGGEWVCPEDMRVGVAAIGYGDGYPRHAPSGTPVLINGRVAGLIGRVSMDMICIDLRRHPDARVGDEVVLWGDGLPVEEVADLAATIAYELVCRIARRVILETVEIGGER
jgi:alanine racemase